VNQYAKALIIGGVILQPQSHFFSVSFQTKTPSYLADVATNPINIKK
jgi:hypothetical protein